jgi:16S rRNA (guanine527-N7)-methyltransferase
MNAITPLSTADIAPMSAAEFIAAAHVSRETQARLETYLAMLTKWQGAINLVGRSTMRDPWRRHFWDSAQLHPLIPAGASVIDLGSGAGFPGLVLAMMGDLHVHLVESDQRKAAFLRETARETGTDVTLHIGRAEQVPPQPGDVVTARALAPVADLLGLATRWLRPGGTCLFLKGRQADTELTDAHTAWRFTAERISSRSDPAATILRLGDIDHV